MSTSLPTDNTVNKAVNEFGIGTYDSDNNTSSHGEDDEDVKSENSPHGDSLPGTHGTDPFGPDRLLSYPQTFASSFASERTIVTQDGRVTTVESYARELADKLRESVGHLPGDQDAETTHRHPKTDNIDSVVPSVAEASKLPEGFEPSARSDYYDNMKMGFTGDEWPDEDTGTWSSEEEPGSNLPGVMKNEVTMDNFLNSLGNFWSGHETEDVSGPQGFPSDDFSENVDFGRNDLQGGRVLASEMKSMNKRQATNIELVGSLTQEFLKEFGKKDLTRRHVMAYLSTCNQPQFLASDIVRCLKLRHSIIVKDVLDEFPTVKTASSSTLASVREKLIKLEIASILKPELSSQFRRCAAKISHIIADLDKYESLQRKK